MTGEPSTDAHGFTTGDPSMDAGRWLGLLPKPIIDNRSAQLLPYDAGAGP
jgi:hypothetical protein